MMLAACGLLACGDDTSSTGDATGGSTQDGDGGPAGGLGEPVKVADVPGDDRVPLHLYVSNQSWDPELVDIRVFIDGVEVVAGDFAVEGQHNWMRFDLLVPRGSLEVRAEALDGEVVLEQTLEVPAEHWAVLDYWYYPGEDPAPFLQLTGSDEPVAFG